ncbi:MAG: DUF2877 domain-containing protein [Granulosicoccus sp.]
MPITNVGLSQTNASQDKSKVAESIGLRLSSTGLQLASGSRVLLQCQFISIGSEAARILQNSHAGRVLATFERSFYVQCDDGILCIGLSSLGEGPLHMLLALTKDQLPAQIATGLLVDLSVVAPECVRDVVAQCHRSADEDNRTLYSGKVVSNVLSTLEVENVQHVIQSVVSREQQGFSWIVNCARWQDHTAWFDVSTGSSDALNASLRRQCLSVILGLSLWLEKSLSNYDEYSQRTSVGCSEHDVVQPTPSVGAISGESLDVSALLGAGPGLTPAGDDLLAGVMLALHRVDRADLSVLIWAWLEPLLITRTNPISAAHLRLAARGQCSAAALDLLERVFNGSCVSAADDVQAAAADIESRSDNIGASSGWDMLAGMCLVLRAL